MENARKIVLTYYWTGEHDIWHKDIDIYKCNRREFDTLRESVKGRGYDFVTIANELVPDRDGWKLAHASGDLCKPKDMPLYRHKFIACYKFLLKHPEYEEIWIVDSSDTEMLKTPTPKDGTLYSGYDAYFPLFKRYATITYLVGGIVEGGVWYPGIFEMGHKYDYDIHRYLRDVCPNEKAWNCGVFGGKRKDVMEFLKSYVELLENSEADVEMVIFNYLIYSQFRNKFKSITSRMTLGEKDYRKWWRHK